MPKATSWTDGSRRPRGRWCGGCGPPKAVLQLVQHRQPVGCLIVNSRQGQWIPPAIRLALATVAHALAAATGPAVSHDHSPTASTSGRHDEAVADAGFGDQQLRPGWVVELAAQAGHMVLERSALLLGAGPPEAFGKEAAGAESPAGG